MIVNKVGRPSKAGERRAEILLAVAAVAAREGIAGTTVAKVAGEAGIQRTLVLHYFGDRGSLIDSFIEQTAAVYGDLQILGDRTASIERRIDAAFDAGHYASRDDLVVWTEIAALAARDEAVRDRIRTLWSQRWLPLIETEIQAARPRAPGSQVRAVSHGIACLVEGYWALWLQGLDAPEQRRHAQACARLLLASLPGVAA